MKFISIFFLILLASCIQPLKIKKVENNFKNIKSKKERVAIFVDLYLDPKLAANNNKIYENKKVYGDGGEFNYYKYISSPKVLTNGIKDLFLDRIEYEVKKLLPNLPIDLYFNLVLDEKNVLKAKYNKSLELNFFIAKKYQITYLFEFIPFINILSPTHWGILF